jgi:gas vesicle protein
MESENLTAFGIGLVAGLVIGGAVALLYAPKTGKETRELIKGKATEVVDEVKEKTSGVIDAVKEKTSGAVKALKS